MGYSIMTAFSDQKTKENMMHFLNVHYRTFKEVTGVTEYKRLDPAMPTLDLFNPPKLEKHLIGFNYSRNGLEAGYIFRMCYWMSLMAGRLRTFKQYGKLPYVIYDGIERWGLFTNTSPEKDETMDYMKVDEIGFHTFLNEVTAAFPNSVSIPNIDVQVKEELQRLTTVWNQKSAD